MHNDIVSTLIKGQGAASVDVQQIDVVDKASVTTTSRGSRTQFTMNECIAYDSSIQQTDLNEASVTTTRGSRTQLNIIAMNECVAYGSSSANNEDVEHIYDEMDEVPIVTMTNCVAYEPTVVPEAGGEHNQSQRN